MSLKRQFRKLSQIQVLKSISKTMVVYSFLLPIRKQETELLLQSKVLFTSPSLKPAELPRLKMLFPKVTKSKLSLWKLTVRANSIFTEKMLSVKKQLPKKMLSNKYKDCVNGVLPCMQSFFDVFNYEVRIIGRVSSKIITGNVCDILSETFYSLNKKDCKNGNNC